MKFTASLFSALAMWLLLTCRASAIQVEALDPSREWQVDKIEISGNDHFSDSQVMAEMISQSRPWYRFWEERPLFDPVTFATDLVRLRRFYEAEGYFRSRITHDLAVDEIRGLVSPRVFVEENRPVVISQVMVEIETGPTEQDDPRLPEKLPVTRGEIFKEQEYQ